MTYQRLSTALSGFILSAITILPAGADVLFLKGGQRIEGEVTPKGPNYEVRTERGMLTIPKRQVEKLVPNVGVLAEKAKSLQIRARALYEEALKLESQPAEMNSRLKEGVDLLRQSVDMLQQARETYVGDAYDYLDKDTVKLFQEMRIYRGKMVSGVGGVPKKPTRVRPKRATVATEHRVPGIPLAPPKPAPKKALKELEAAAKGGAAEDVIALAWHYYVREWGGRMATSLFKKASRKKHPWADYGLGLLALENRGDRKGYAEARRRFINASNKGMDAAHVRLAMMHFYGWGTRRSMKDAETSCQRAIPEIIFLAEEGDLEALHMVGWMHLEGIGVEKNVDDAVACWKYAAESGSVPVQFQLGEIYDKGEHVNTSWEDSAKWMGMAAEEGYAPAQAYAGELHDEYFYRKPNPHLDRNKARGWYERAMAQGHPKGIYWMGWFTIKGEGGIVKAPLKGLELLKRSAAVATGRLRLQAYNDIGYNYATGKYVRQNKKEGIKYYEYAAKLGLPMAQYNMGVRSSNPRKSMAWYLAAARQGYGHASSNLGDLYARGKGVCKDLDEAERWYETAIQQGWKDAEAALIRLRDQRIK